MLGAHRARRAGPRRGGGLTCDDSSNGREYRHSVCRLCDGLVRRRCRGSGMNLSAWQFLRSGLTPVQRLIVIALAVSVPTAGAQEPTLKDALSQAARYVADFQRQLSTIVAEETYLQEIKYQVDSFRDATDFPRRLKSGLLLIRLAGTDRYVECRDVFEVDGNPGRDRAERFTRLLKAPASGDLLANTIRESARYNIGRITRTVNPPLLP